MNISVVIPNYNGENLLKKNLPPLIDLIKDYKEGDREIIVVDDASKDESKEFLRLIKEKDSILKFFINRKNLGFSSTVDKGAEKAKGEIIILLNTDVLPDKGFLEPLLSHFKTQEVFAVGCMDRSIEGDKEILRGRGVGSWKRGFLVHKKGDIRKSDTLWVSGGSGAFRKSIWDKLGGLDSLYNPFYWEDIDLSYRAKKAGYKTIFEKGSAVIHRHEEGAIKSNYTSSKIKIISYRNQFIFAWKNINDVDLILSHILWLPYHFIKAFLRLDKEFFAGFWEALVLSPKIYRKRRQQQKFIKRSDRQVLKEYI